MKVNLTLEKVVEELLGASGPLTSFSERPRGLELRAGFAPCWVCLVPGKVLKTETYQKSGGGRFLYP